MKPWESPRERSAPAWNIERFYDIYGGVLTQTLIDGYGVPRAAAEGMVIDALGAVITSAVEDPETWVIATACKSGMAYQQGVTRAAISAAAAAGEVGKVKDALFLREAMAALPEPAQRALELRFGENRSVEEIAEELGVTTVYVKRLIFRALRIMREEQRRRTPGSSR